MREINSIQIHCSDSKFGNVELIDKWHKERGFDEIGYHFVIKNGYETNSKDYIAKFDGLICKGRDIEKIPASIKGHNEDAIAICLIGIDKFSDIQLQSLYFLVKTLKEEFEIDIGNIYCHYELDNKKTCPNLDGDWLRLEIMKYIMQEPINKEIKFREIDYEKYT